MCQFFNGSLFLCPPRAARPALGIDRYRAVGNVLPERTPDAGLLILRDDEPVEPEVTLLPTPPPKA